MRLILVRHGQTASNVGNHLDTAEPGPGLTPLGREQAAALPAALAGEPIEAVYASTLVRTQETAAPLAAALGLEVQVRPGLREVSAGDLEMRNDWPSIEQYVRTFLAWADGSPDLRMPGGETGEEVLARFDAVVEEIAGSGAATVVAVSHGAIMRGWVAARAANVSVEHAATHPVSNTGAVVVAGDPVEGWVVEAWEGRALGPARVESTADGAAAEVVDVAARSRPAPK